MKKEYLLLTVLLVVSLLAVQASALENLAFKVSAVEASTFYSDSYNPDLVHDGIVWRHEMRLPAWYTDYETEADLTIKWKSPVTIAKAIFYDLTSADDNIVSGTMKFSDGTTVEFGALNPDGTATEVALPKTITCDSVVIHVVAHEDSMYAGLDEVELLDPSGKNVAVEATAEASSVLPDGDPYWYIPEQFTGWHVAQKAINGVASVNRPTDFAENEWASQGEPLPWIKLTWASPIKIGTIVLVDRVNGDDWITGGEITFSDGTVITFGELDDVGAPLFIDIPDITADSFTIQVTSSEGPNPGLAEIEVYTEHFNADGTPIATESAAPVTQAPEASGQDAGSAPVVIAPATADAGIMIAALSLLSGAAAVTIARRKNK